MHDPLDPFGRLATRRAVLRGGMVGALTLSLGSVLAACGEDSDGGATTGGSQGKVTTSADDMEILKAAVGPFDERYAGKGQTWKLGAAGPVTQNAAWWSLVTGGAKVAADHIQLLGGPRIDLVVVDHGGTTEAKKAAEAASKLHDQGIGAMLTSYYNAAGALSPYTERYEILAVDGGGGNANDPGRPYFWGARSNHPYDSFPGTVKYVQQAFPEVKKVTVCYQNVGKFISPAVKAIQEEFKGIGVAVSLVPLDPRQTDYSNAVNAVRSQNPDLVVITSGELDPAYFMKSYVVAGINKPVICLEYNRKANDVAGESYQGMYFVFDSFNMTDPASDWARLMSRDWEKATHTPPDLGVAAGYEDVFLFWQLYRKVLEQGGDVNSGKQMQDALVANPDFPSVVGGSGATIGRLKLDTKTHSCIERPMLISQLKGDKLVDKAHFTTTTGQFSMV